MGEYVEDLFEAFRRVDDEFYYEEAIRNPEIIQLPYLDRNTFIQMTERQFAAELYHQMRNIMGESDENEERYRELRLGFEVSKKYVENVFIEGKKYFIPDLILHQSQLIFHPDYQKIYVEIKTNPSLNHKRIRYDLAKTIFAMHQYGFKNGVFISINTNYDRILRLIKNYITKAERRWENEGLERLWKNMYLFHSKENERARNISFERIKNTVRIPKQ